MADEGHAEKTVWAVRRVPGNLLGFLTSRIAEYVGRAENISAEIHECPGQPAKLVLYGAKDVFEPTQKVTDSVQDDTTTTNRILVKKFPPAVDGVMLEAFFESRKTGGGGPVKDVQFNQEKNWAVIEFCEADAVERVMSNAPIKMMAKELNVSPFIPLLQEKGPITNLEFCNLPKELTDDLLTMHAQATSEATEISSAEYKSDDGEEPEDGDISVTQLTDPHLKTEGFVRETITRLQPVQLQMLHLTNYTKAVLEDLPDIKVEIDLEKNRISLMGDAKTVVAGYRHLVEAFSNFNVNRIDNKPAEQIELYKRERVIEYINKRLEEQNIVCAWEVTEQFIVICSMEESIVECTKIIDTSVTEIQFPVSRESSATLLTQEWLREVKQIQDENDVVYMVFSDNTSTNVTVMATDKEISGIACRIKAFLKSQLVIYSEDLHQTDFQNLYKLNSSLALKLLDQIAEGLSLYYVTITPAPGWVYSKFTVTGTIEGIKKAKKRMAELDGSF